MNQQHLFCSTIAKSKNTQLPKIPFDLPMENIKKDIIDAKNSGLNDFQIAEKFGISLRKLEELTLEIFGVNIDAEKQKSRNFKKFKKWKPKDFKLEDSTVWSFKNRGDWATHNGYYRGNWSPYIPRNLILRYSKPGDLVLDYFAGSGTTAIEAKLLGRRCIARDINPEAIEHIKRNLNFSPPVSLFEEYDKIFEPVVETGDARKLLGINNNEIDLICAHPPYANIIQYTSNILGDLSTLKPGDFINELKEVALESFRVLKQGKICAILIGDLRKNKKVVPLGFQVIEAFIEAGFILKELVIKRQHNCKTTGFWYSKSVEYNFLLLAHEYLLIFEKPNDKNLVMQKSSFKTGLKRKKPNCSMQIAKLNDEKIEATTVWILDDSKLDNEIERNLLARFLRSDLKYVKYTFEDKFKQSSELFEPVSLMHIKIPNRFSSETHFLCYLDEVKEIASKAKEFLVNNGFFVVEAADFKANNYMVPTGYLLWKALSKLEHLAIKEIVVVPCRPDISNTRYGLHINHKYLLVFSRNSNANT